MTQWLLCSSDPEVYHSVEIWRPPGARDLRHVTLCGTEQTTRTVEIEDTVFCLICRAKQIARDAL